MKAVWAMCSGVRAFCCWRRPPLFTHNRPVERDARFECEPSLMADSGDGMDAVFRSAISTLRQKKQKLDRQENELPRGDQSAAARRADDPRRQRLAWRRLLDGNHSLPAAQNGVT